MLYHLLNIFGLVNKVFAQSEFPNQPPSSGFPNQPLPTSVSPAIGNPLKAKSIILLLNELLNIVYQIGIPVIAVFIVYSGFLFVKAQGNESQLTEAKKTLLWTMIGAAIVLGAVVISKVIETTITSL